MDILDFFGTFYLNHLSPLWGYFFLLLQEGGCMGEGGVRSHGSWNILLWGGKGEEKGEISLFYFVNSL